MQYLLAIAIGPVQGFIAAGRKTRDLWYGSELLSLSAAAAARTLNETAELIFPHESALGEGTSVPNKLLAILGEDQPPRELAERAQQSAARVLIDEWEELKKRFPNHVDIDLGDKQVADFFEFYAAWWPYDPATYAANRTDVERFLSGRKALRDFKPAHGVRKQRKSSLDPGLESVVIGTRPWVRSALKLKAGEELDGISLTKRLAQNTRFVSTARLAIEPFIQRVGAAPELGSLRQQAAQIENLADQLRIDSPVESFATDAGGNAQFASFPFDTQLFWDPGKRDIERLKPKNVLPADNPEEKLRDLEEVEAMMAALHRDAHALRKKLGVREFPAYLAILAADGDRMGVALSKMTTPTQHQEFSERLVAFAKSAKKTVAGYQGALLYSGGDDVIAFLPVHRAIACAQELHRQFDSVNAAEMPERVTLSAGIAIGHYGAHLQNLLEWAREAEKLAKEHNKGERNALAVSLHPHSAGGNAVSAVSSWNDTPTTWWDRWVDWHRRDLLPDSAAFDLRELSKQLKHLSSTDLITRRYRKEPLPEHGQHAWSLLELEVDRVLRRKRGLHGREALTDLMVGTMLARIQNDPDRLDALVNELLIARRLAEVLDIAEGRIEGSEPR